MNILLTSASRKVGLVQAFQQALADVSPGLVHGADCSELSAGLYLADRHHLIGRSDGPGFVDALLRLAVSQQIDLLIPTRDEALPLLARHQQRFLDAGVRVMVACAETVEICQDKAAFNRFCRAHDFAIATERALADLPEDIDVFVRDRQGKASRNATRIRTRQALVAHLRQTPDAVIQDFVAAPEYTIDLCADFSGRIVSVVPRARIRVSAGESVVARTVREPVLIDAAIALAQSLNLVGHNTIQAFWDGSVVRFIEVNPRFGGGASLGFAAGAHTPTLLVRMVLGEHVPSQVGVFQSDLVMLRYSRDVFLPAHQLVAP